MTEYCVGCRKTHDGTHWKSWIDSGSKKFMYLCDMHFKPSSHEWVPQRITEERKQYQKSTLQPWREGEASSEFMEAYPEQASKMFSTEDKIKSKLLSPNLAEITFDVYLESPTQFSDIIGTYYDQEFIIGIEPEV